MTQAETAAARNKAWQEGQQAARKDTLRSANPYAHRPDGTGQAWEMGYREVMQQRANAQQRERKAAARRARQQSEDAFDEIARRVAARQK